MHGYLRITASVLHALITPLLGTAFVIATFLLIRHALESPRFESHGAGELLLVVVLSLEGIIAVRHLRQTRLDSLHVVLNSARQHYSSAEMMLALVNLWRFRQEHGDQFVQVYLQRWRQDEERIAKLPADAQLDALRGTLHYQRRLVKEFYNSLAGMYELQLLPKEMLYTYWSDAELKIIPEILIPLEMAVAVELRTERDSEGWLQRLRRVYNDRPASAS